MRPASRGSLRISSADPYAPPAIDPRCFAEEDVRAVLSGITTVREIARSSAPAEWGSRRPVLDPPPWTSRSPTTPAGTSARTATRSAPA
ncbi:GMC oxidoreductase [Streptomyces sp. NPDC088194]|uniref:GMC oxidoreductase n=1 Tax=Streptomyces sp. NPDC088194 TaxID=3154931 RepID=UPI00344BAC74